MEPFSLYEWIRTKKKVITAAGEPVRILCFDKKGTYPIVAAIGYNENTIIEYFIDGKVSRDINTCRDLFFSETS